MREEFGKNLNKFELYTRRNIFVGSKGEDSAALDKEMEEVREQSMKLAEYRQKYAELSEECREAEQMLADMKSSLFGMCVVNLLFIVCKIIVTFVCFMLIRSFIGYFCHAYFSKL